MRVFRLLAGVVARWLCGCPGCRPARAAGWHEELRCPAALLSRPRSGLVGGRVPFWHREEACPVVMLAAAYEELHAGVHGCAPEGCGMPGCARLAAELGPGWHREAVAWPEVAALARSCARLHQRLHGCALAACGQPSCAGLARELVPGWPGSVAPRAPAGSRPAQDPRAARPN